MIEDKATEKWKERMKKLGLIVNMKADSPKPKAKVKGKVTGKGKDRLRRNGFLIRKGERSG